jgi:hypothetical protein
MSFQSESFVPNCGSSDLRRDGTVLLCLEADCGWEKAAYFPESKNP